MLEEAVIERIVARYAHGSAFQRWHMRGRLRLCPYDALLKHLTGQGNILDIGCGFGHLAWFMEENRADLVYFGTDIDERKIALVKGCPPSLSRPNFLTGDIQALKGLPVSFGNIVLLDVLYLMPWEEQVRLIEWCLSKLDENQNSSLVIKTMDRAMGWVGFRTVAEEWVMVHLLRRTRSSGTINGAKDSAAYSEVAHKLGYQFEIENLPTWNPSSIFRIHK
jgi:2-polyprenyl-3-methyl-5-hydroxy-6-metoxy-1,4-benzoquinol methylase